MYTYTKVNVFLDILYAAILTILGALSAYFLSKVLFHKTVKSFQISFICILLVNLLQSIGVLLSIIIFYIDNHKYMYLQFGLNLVIVVVSIIQLLAILLTDIEILRVYSVLNPKITHRKLNLFRTCCIVLFVVFPTSGILMNFVTLPANIGIVSYLCIGFYGLFAVVVDNCQSLYLIYAVYRFKESKFQNQLSLTIITKFKELIRYIIITLIIDWVVI
jgi:hypothetical protein